MLCIKCVVIFLGQTEVTITKVAIMLGFTLLFVVFFLAYTDLVARMNMNLCYGKNS